MTLAEQVERAEYLFGGRMEVLNPTPLRATHTLSCAKSAIQNDSLHNYEVDVMLCIYSRIFVNFEQEKCFADGRAHGEKDYGVGFTFLK